MSKSSKAQAAVAAPAGKKSKQAVAEEFDVSGSESDGDDGLLPKDISPVHYALHLVPNYSDWSFDARLVVSLRITGETDLLQFNAIDLEIVEATVRTAAGEDIKPTRTQHDEEEEVTTLRFDEPLRLGDATLTIDYRGRIGDEMVGLYRSHYTHEGKQHTILVTQFESSVEDKHTRDSKTEI